MSRRPPPGLLRALGVTRLSRLTTMDRTGVEVAAAVRPTGHVLQVTQGKGRTLEQASWSALGEAAELFAAEHPDPRRLVWASGADLDGLVLDDDGLARAWCRGARLSDAAPVWVAAERVYCPPAGSAWLGPATTSWSSNGLGAHVDEARAIEQAVLEVWERHALAQVAPGGWSTERLRRAHVRWRPAAVERLEARGFLVLPGLVAERPLPVAAVLLFDREDPSVPLTAGYACRRSGEAALEAALLEAEQSRLTEIHGAREDVAVGARATAGALLELASEHGRRRRPRGTVSGWPRALSHRVVVVRLLEHPLVVVKAIGVDLTESELLR